MLVIAKQDITIFRIVEVEDITRYYTLTKDWPDKPTTNPPSSEWVDTEPETSFKQSASGTSLKLTDVSSINHTMDVKVRSKNLIPYPYSSPNGTIINGITWTYTYDGTLIANGTATKDSNFVIVGNNNAIPVAGQNVTLSGCPDDGGTNKYGIYYYDTFTSRYDYGEGVTFIPVGVVIINAIVYEGETVSDLVFKPQLELGSTATEYTPYIEDFTTCVEKLTDEQVVSYGGSSFNNMSMYGVTWSWNASTGTLTANGTATSSSTLSGLTIYNISKSKKYFLEGCPAGGSASTYRLAVQYPDASYESERDIGEGIYFTPKDTQLRVCVEFDNGTVFDNVAFKPRLYEVVNVPATVTTYGKNLFDLDNATKRNGVSTFAKEDNAIIVTQTNADKYVSANVELSKKLVGKTVTITADSTTSGGNNSGICIRWVTQSGLAAGNMIYGTPDSNGRIAVTGVVPQQSSETYNILAIMFYSNASGSIDSGVTYTVRYSNIQLELGSTATDYKPYIAPTEYEPTADGTVNGVTSIYPTTTLMSDTDGVIIDAEYSKDTSESLYFTDLTTYTDDTYKYSEVSKSSDYEAAKEAFNKALISENTAQDAQDATDNLNETLTKTITEQYSSLITNIDSISGSVTKLETTVSENNSDLNTKISTLQQQVDLQITEDQVNIQIEEKLQNGVTKIETSTGFTFDENGLNVSKSDSKTNTQITEDGMYVNNTETGDNMLTANKDGVNAVNLHVTTYLIVGGRSRFENYKTDRTGCFWIGG